MKMNNVFVKLLVSILIVLTLVNFISSIDVSMNYSFASEEGDERTNDLLGGIIGSIGDAIVNAIKWLILAPFRAARSINYLLASAGGTTGGVPATEISPFDIFFNRFTLLDANIFSTTDRDGNALDPDSMVYKIRTNTAVWYYAIRTLAIGVIAIMLLWNLIRSISKNTTAEQKVVAKNAITDWVLSFALVMFMHIIIIIVLNFNDLLLEGIQSFTPYGDAGDFFDALENAVFSSNLVLGVASLIVYALLNYQTLKYILIYIQRLLTIVLLIMISPIVPVTYSTDRMRGGRGAALNGWLKELLFNVFIQTLHAIVYAALVSVAMAALGSGSASIVGMEDLGTALVAIASMLFVKYAEKMVKTIFGFDSSQVLNTNVFSDAATTIANVSSSVRNTATRVAMGGPVVSFGQNVDGSHIGIGQVVQGIGNSAGRNLGQIRQTGTAFMNGLNGVDTQGNSFAGAVGNLLGAPGADGKDGEATASAEADATAIAEANIETEDGNEAGANSEAEVIIADGGSGIDIVGDMSEEERQRKKDQLQDAKINEGLGKTNEDIDETNNELNRAKSEFAAALNEVANKDQEETQTNTTERIETTEETEVVENNESETETIIEGEAEQAKVPEASIPVEMSGGASPELLDELKKELKAILNDDKESLNQIKQELKEQLDEIKNNLDDKTVEDIEKTVDSLWDNPEALEKYLKSLPEGSNERKYAETFAKLNTVMAIDNDQMSTEDKLDTVIGTYKAQGLNVPEEAKEMKTSNEVDRLESANITTTTGVARTEQAVKEVNEEVNEESESKVDAQPDPKISDIKTISLRATMKDLAEIEPQKFRVEGKLEGEIQHEIEEDFTAKIEEFTKKMGREPKGLKDIYDNIDKKAQKQFADYKNRKISPRDLEGDARNLAVIEREARHLGFEMQSAQEFELSFDDGTKATAKDANKVIDLLAARKKSKTA